MTFSRCFGGKWILALGLLGVIGCTTPATINQLQFVGSHNSYKQAMTAEYFADLTARNPAAAQSLDYSHISLTRQLDLGLRKLELDVFYQPATQRFSVGHVQVIDMNSHCAWLRDCLEQIKAWSNEHPAHVPLWISFNAKDQKIDGLPDPAPFDAQALWYLDQVLDEVLGDRLIRPQDVKQSPVPQWPSLSQARGKVLLILDEVGVKRDLYWQNWRERPMFTNAPLEHEAAAIMIINDPIAQQALIKDLVGAGYMVRTRADADTREARTNDVSRRDAAFASGAQAVSTDFYLPATRFGTDYQVKLEHAVRCNPVTTKSACWVSE